MKNIFSDITSSDLKKRRKIRQPSFIHPMLATLTNLYFSKQDWIYEHKFDGERCLAFKKNGVVLLLSRNHNSMNSEYPELVKALEQQEADNFIIDGEIVARDKAGVSDFQMLQGRMHLERTTNKSVPIAYCIFDLMYVAGYDIQMLPLLARKKILKKLLRYNKLLSYTDHIVGDGIPYFKKACKLKWEGVIAKSSESEYANKRSRDWLKFKCIMQQELVIGGYTTPRGSRQFFGALLVGYYQDGKLIYAGKVGTGYSEETLAMLGKKLHKLAQKKCSFTNYDGKEQDVHWVKPMLVAEFQFAQWTRGDKLRVGRYKGLRDDKAARDVVKEVPKAIGPS